MLRAAPSRPGGSGSSASTSPADCCYDPATGALHCPNNATWHGRKVLVVSGPHQVGGQKIVTVRPLAETTKVVQWRVPVCAPKSATFDPYDSPGDCCLKVSNSTLHCPGNSWHGQQVQVVRTPAQTGDGSYIVIGGPFPNRTRIMPCPGGRPDPEPCCVDAETSTLRCPGHPLHGTAVVIQEVNAQNATVLVMLADKSWKGWLPLCPDADQPDCCFNATTKMVECADGTSFPVDNYNVYAPGLAVVWYTGPGGARMVVEGMPLCPDTGKPDCCVDASTTPATLHCPGHPMHGTPVEIHSVDEATGMVWVSDLEKTWKDELPLCPDGGRHDCCLDTTNNTLHCPGTQLHGLQVIVLQAGITNARVTHPSLEPFKDGTDPSGAPFMIVPLCPEEDCPPCPECPPPRECPPCDDCPTCPPGMLYDPETGQCVQCASLQPVCPPGTLLNQQTGECVTCPECPPDDGCPTCPPGMLLDPRTGQCVECPPDRDCPPCDPPNGCRPAPWCEDWWWTTTGGRQ